MKETEEMEKKRWEAWIERQSVCMRFTNRIKVMRYWWGRDTANKGKGEKKKKRAANRKERVTDENREVDWPEIIDWKRQTKEKTGRQIENEQQRGAVSSILAQVGSGPDIFSSPQGVCRSLQRAPFPLIPPKKTLSHFPQRQTGTEQQHTSDTAAVLFLFHAPTPFGLSFIFLSVTGRSLTSKNHVIHIHAHTHMCEHRQLWVSKLCEDLILLLWNYDNRHGGPQKPYEMCPRSKASWVISIRCPINFSKMYL